MQELEKGVQSVEEVKPAEVKKRPRMGLIIGSVVGLAVLLAGAAYVGGRLLNQRPVTAGPGGLVRSGPGGADQAVSVEVEGAPELPDAPPEVTGIFSKRGDNSVFVTSGDGGFTVMIDDTGKVTADAAGGTQEVEVVITGETLVYQDATEPPSGGPVQGSKVQQKVEPGSIDEIGENSFVTAWGERRGDRLIARVVLYSQPMFFGAPGSP